MIKQTLKEWFKEGIQRGCSFVLITYDGFENTERPFFIYPEADLDVEIDGLYRNYGLYFLDLMDMCEEMEQEIELAWAILEQGNFKIIFNTIKGCVEN